jgi:hypothetical protein
MEANKNPEGDGAGRNTQAEASTMNIAALARSSWGRRPSRGVCGGDDCE